MYIIRYILASCKIYQHKLDNGSSILIANLTAKGSDLDYLTNLDEDRDADDLKQPAAASDHLDHLGRGLDQDDRDNQQQQQQGFLRRRPSQPGRFSLPGKQI